MVAKKKPGKVSEAYVVKRPASPQLRPPTGSARALSRTANAYVNACSILAERELALLNAGTQKTLERAWDTVLDDGWEGADRTRLDASRATREKTLNDKLATRVLKAPTERALRLAWSAATKAGRADELAPLRATALSRLGLEDPEAASLAA